MVGPRKRKNVQVKAPLQPKRTKLEVIEEDLDDFLSEMQTRNTSVKTDPVNSDVSKVKAVADSVGDKSGQKSIECRIKENINEEFMQVQAAVNKAMAKKDQDLMKLIDEKSFLVKSLNELNEELTQKEKEVKNLQNTLDGHSLKSNEDQSKLNKLTANIERLVKQNKELVNDNKTLNENVNKQENIIKKCRDDFKAFGQKVDEYKQETEIKDKLYKKEVAEKDMKLTELEMNRLKEMENLQEKLKTSKDENDKLKKALKETNEKQKDDLMKERVSLQEKLKTSNHENDKLKKALKQSKDKHKDDLETKERALSTMQKLIDTEKKQANKYKQRSRRNEEELSAKSDVISKNEETIKRLKKETLELALSIETHKKKSYERKVKLKCAQQSYNSNLNEFLDKYQKNIEKLKTKREKEKLKKKKNNVTVKLVLGEKISEKSLLKDMDMDSVVTKQYSTDEHTTEQGQTCVSVSEESDKEEASITCSSSLALDTSVDFSDQDIPSTSIHLQKANNIEESVCDQELEVSTVNKTPPRRNEFSSFILWDESALRKTGRHEDNMLVGFDLSSSFMSSSAEPVINTIVRENQKTSIAGDARGKDDTTALLLENDNQSDGEFHDDTLEEMVHPSQDNHGDDDGPVKDNSLQLQHKEHDNRVVNENTGTDLESEDMINKHDLVQTVIEHILASVFTSNIHHSSPEVGGYNSGTEEPSADTEEDVVGRSELVDDSEDMAVKAEVITENTDNVNSRWYDGAKEKILSNPGPDFREETDIKEFKFKVRNSVESSLMYYYNNPEAPLGEYKIKDKEQFGILCKMLSHKFRAEIKESFLAFSGSCRGISLTPDNKWFIKHQIDMFLDNLQVANRARKNLGQQAKARCGLCDFLDNSWSGVSLHFESTHKDISSAL